MRDLPLRRLKTPVSLAILAPPKEGCLIKDGPKKKKPKKLGPQDRMPTKKTQKIWAVKKKTQKLGPHN